MMSWGFYGFLDVVFVYDVSKEHLCPLLVVCGEDVDVVRVFLPSRGEEAVVSVDGGLVFPSLTVVPCALDVPAVVVNSGAAFDRG